LEILSHDLVVAPLDENDAERDERANDLRDVDVAVVHACLVVKRQRLFEGYVLD